LYLINGNMLPLKNAGAFANTPTDDGKEEKSDEEILELEDPNGDQSGDTGAGSREDAVSELDEPPTEFDDLRWKKPYTASPRETVGVTAPFRLPFPFRYAPLQR